MVMQVVNRYPLINPPNFFCGHDARTWSMQGSNPILKTLAVLYLTASMYTQAFLTGDGLCLTAFGVSLDYKAVY